MKSNMLATSALVALAGLSTMFASATARADLVRESTGYSANPGWVTGGGAMFSYVNGGNSTITGLRGLSFTQPTSIDDFQGVMSGGSGFNWASSILGIELNIYSSTSNVSANPQIGDVYHLTGLTIDNLVSGVPPAWGNNNGLNQANRWVDLGFTPFTLPAGDYLASIVFRISAGAVGWTETMHEFGLAGDVVTFSSSPGQLFEYSTNPNYHTGDAAVRISTHTVPAPGTLALLMCGAIPFLRRKKP